MIGVVSVRQHLFADRGINDVGFLFFFYGYRDIVLASTWRAVTVLLIPDIRMGLRLDTRVFYYHTQVNR